MRLQAFRVLPTVGWGRFFSSSAGERIKVSFAKCPVSSRPKPFENSSCIMPISVGQNLKHHEGEEFIATMKLVDRSFSSCTLVVDDSVQHYGMMIWSREPKNAIYFQAILEGDRWLSQNKNAYESLSIPYKILRWNDWVAHPSYSSQRALIDELYESNASYRQAVNFTINEYIQRRSRHAVNPIDQALATYCCLKYLLEECAVMSLWALEGYDFEVYPTGRNAAMKAAYDALVKSSYPGKLLSVSLEFRSRRSASQEQQMSSDPRDIASLGV